MLDVPPEQRRRLTTPLGPHRLELVESRVELQTPHYTDRSGT